MGRKEYTTKARTLILEFLDKNRDNRFSATDICTYLTAREQPADKATVYRNLEKMTEDGILMKYKTTEDNHCLYQYIPAERGCHEHLHLQCRRCGKVIHLECEFMSEIAEHLKAHHGFALSCEESVLMGLCETCSANS